MLVNKNSISFAFVVKRHGYYLYSWDSLYSTYSNVRVIYDVINDRLWDSSTRDIVVRHFLVLLPPRFLKGDSADVSRFTIHEVTY